MATANFYSRYDPPPSVGMDFEKPSITQPQFKDDCDVNSIIRRFERTGQIDHLSSIQGVFADVGDMPTDMLSAQSYIRDAQERFMSLPASVREEYGNNPYMLLDAVQKGVISLGETNLSDPASDTVPEAPAKRKRASKKDVQDVSDVEPSSTESME